MEWMNSFNGSAMLGICMELMLFAMQHGMQFLWAVVVCVVCWIPCCSFLLQLFIDDL